MSTWSWISRLRERRSIDLYIEHASRVLSVVEHAVNALLAYREGNIERLSEEWRVVYEKEKEADEYKRRIFTELSESVFHPINREEVVRLVIITDDIASYAKAWCRRLVLMRGERLPPGIVDRAIEMAKSVHKAVALVLEASRELRVRNKKRVLELAGEVESIEEKVDDLHIDALVEALDYCNATKPSNCILVREIITTIENAADRCEDAADVLRSIALLD